MSICLRNGIKRKGSSCSFNNLCSYPYCTDAHEEPPWVCLKCADKRGAKMPQGHRYTAHTGICGICQQTTTVTEPRDFGRTRHLLKVKKDDENII